MRVLFVGETIEDVYHYGHLLGRATKEPIIVLEHDDTETFKGGVWAAAEHARSFCEKVDVLTGNVTVKERWLDIGHMRKLFEVYRTLKETHVSTGDLPIEDYDAVIVTDYGHGMMAPELIELLNTQAKFLAVNVQTNSGNFGFSLATKYPRADYLCMDELEARLATQNRAGDIKHSVAELSNIAPRVVVTLGRYGAIGWSSAEGGYTEVPAFTDRVVDTMGAGDAFFAITALFAKDTPMEELLRIGNAAGALKAQTLGHRTPVTKEALNAYLAAH